MLGKIVALDYEFGVDFDDGFVDFFRLGSFCPPMGIAIRATSENLKRVRI